MIVRVVQHGVIRRGSASNVEHMCVALAADVADVESALTYNT